MTDRRPLPESNPDHEINEALAMFLDCPAYLDQDGAVRCGLPAEVSARYTMRSTDGPLESVMIRCPSGHWFNGPIGSLTFDSGQHHGPTSTAVASSVGRDSCIGRPERLDGSSRPAVRDVPVEPGQAFPRPNGAPPYYLGRPAGLWITAMTPRRRHAAFAAPASTPLPVFEAQAR